MGPKKTITQSKIRSSLFSRPVERSRSIFIPSVNTYNTGTGSQAGWTLKIETLHPNSLIFTFFSCSPVYYVDIDCAREWAFAPRKKNLTKAFSPNEFRKMRGIDCPSSSGFQEAQTNTAPPQGRRYEFSLKKGIREMDQQQFRNCSCSGGYLPSAT